MVFKHQNDFYRTFDLDYFQQKLLERFMPEYLKMTPAEKEAIYFDYIKSLEDDVDAEEPIIKGDDGYYITKNVVKSRKIIEEPKEYVDMRRKKKKKNPYKNDFYKFQVKNIKDQISLEGLGNAYMGIINGSHYVENGDEEDLGIANEENLGDFGGEEFEGKSNFYFEIWILKSWLIQSF